MSDALDNLHVLYRRHQYDPDGEATCLKCRATYPTRAIRKWIDGGTTAVCPRCRLDFVVPGRPDPAWVERVREDIFAPFPGMAKLTPEEAAAFKEALSRPVPEDGD